MEVPLLQLESVDPMNPRTEVSLDSRLTVRVRNIWNKLAAHGIPRRSQIDPRSFGSDWSNCFMIDLSPEVSQSRFGYVGNALQDLTWANMERATLSELPKDTLVKTIISLIPRVISDKMPVGFAGLTQHDDKNILYRTVLAPLTESGDQVDGISAGAMYREVFAQTELPDLPAKRVRKKKQRTAAESRGKSKMRS